MITASHNPYQDNGVKIIRPDGEMLHVKDEKRLEDFVNEKDLHKAF
jgi:phosphomannomutase